MGEKEAVENMVGACEEGVSRGDMMECDLEKNTGYSDKDYEELGKNLERTMRKTSKRVRAQNERKPELKRTRKSTDSDEEYDQLTSKVWKDYEEKRIHHVNDQKVHHSKRVKKGQKDAYVNREEAKSQDENDEESTYDEEKADSEEEFKDLPRQTVKTKDMPCTFDEPADDAVTVLSSSGDAASDSDYICGDEDVHSTESEITDGQSAIVENSSLLQNERNGLLTELVDVIGEKNIDEGSFLEEDKGWKNYVKKFKDNRVNQGHKFQTSQETADELSRVYEEEDSSYDTAFQVMFEGDGSDNDDAIDTEWVPSDCEQDEHETNKNRTTEGDMDTSTEEFLVDF